MMRQMHWSRPKWAPGPWATAHGQVLPTQFRTLPPELVRSQAFPKQERARNIRALATVVDRRPGVDASIMFVPREATQGYGSGPNALNAVARSARRLSDLQKGVLAKYMGGQSLTPPEVRELMHMRAPQTNPWLAWLRGQNRRAGGPPAGAHQVAPFPRGGRGANRLVCAGRQRAFAYGAGGQVMRAANLTPVRRAQAAMMQRMVG